MTHKRFFSARFSSFLLFLPLFWFAGCVQSLSSMGPLGEAFCKLQSKEDRAKGCVIKGSRYLGAGQRDLRLKRVLTLRWRRPIDPNYKSKTLTWKLSPEEHAAPLLGPDGETVYVGNSGGFVTAFSIKNGKSLWSTKLRGRIVAQIQAHQEYLYVGTTSGFVYGLDRFSGKQKWVHQTKGEILAKCVHVEESEDDGIQPSLVCTNSNNEMIALHAQTGKWLWNYRRDPPEQLTIRGQSPPVVHDTTVYTGFSDGTVAAIQLKDGQVVWTRSLRVNDRFPDVDMEVVIHNDTLYASSYNSALHALNIKDGKTKWKHKLIAVSGVHADNKEVLVSNAEGVLLSLSPKDGKKRWKQTYKKAGIFSSPIVDKNYIILSSAGHGIYVLQRNNGSLLQNLRFGQGFSAPPLFYGSQLYAFSNASFLYAFTTQSRDLAIRDTRQSDLF